MDVKPSLLINYGYLSVYDVRYNVSTTTTDLSVIRGRCLSTSSVCVGGADLVDNIKLMACGNCFSIILRETPKITPNFVQGVWWYYTLNFSFGFSPSSEITQDPADNANTGGSNRLSWILPGAVGSSASRLGQLRSLDTNNGFRKLIYLLL